MENYINLYVSFSYIPNWLPVYLFYISKELCNHIKKPFQLSITFLPLTKLDNGVAICLITLFFIVWATEERWSYETWRNQKLEREIREKISHRWYNHIIEKLHVDDLLTRWQGFWLFHGMISVRIPCYGCFCKLWNDEISNSEAINCFLLPSIERLFGTLR